MVSSRDCINREPPKIAQFTAIKGKKIPKELYKEGDKIYIDCEVIDQEIKHLSYVRDKDIGF